MADNKKISDLGTDNTLISYDGFVGWVNAGGGVNLNKRISGKYIRYGSINSNDSGGLNRIAFYGNTNPIDASNPTGPQDTSLGGSEAFKFDQSNNILQIGNSSSAGSVEISGNYASGSTQPILTFKGGVAGGTTYDVSVSPSIASINYQLVLPPGATLTNGAALRIKSTTVVGSITEIETEFVEDPSSTFTSVNPGLTSGTVTWNYAGGYNATLVVNAGGNTLALAADWTEGKSGVLVITGDSSNLTFPANSIFAGGAPTLVDGQTHVFSLLYKSATELIWSYGLDFKA